MSESWICVVCDKPDERGMCLCDIEEGPWCPDCFAATDCGQGRHGEGCATSVFGGVREDDEEPYSEPIVSVRYGGRAAVDVLLERRRQVEVEGYDAAHDDAHSDGSIAAASACYALAGVTHNPPGGLASDDAIGGLWPWGFLVFKRRDHRRNLVRAAALAIAEIERLDRAAAAEASA